MKNVMEVFLEEYPEPSVVKLNKHDEWDRKMKLTMKIKEKNELEKETEKKVQNKVQNEVVEKKRERFLFKRIRARLAARRNPVSPTSDNKNKEINKFL